MRFSTIIVSGVMAALSVSAQNITESVVSGTASGSPAQATQAACLSACSPTDTKCRDACIVDPLGVPNQAIDCIRNCVQGDGSASANLAFQNCNKACVSSYATVTPTTTARPGVTGGAGSGSSASTTGAAAGGNSSSGSAASSGSGSSTGAAVKTGTATTGGSGTSSTSAAATASSSSAAADNVRFGMSTVGAFGVFAAIFAL